MLQVVNGVPVQVLVSVCGFVVDLGLQCVIIIHYHQGVQKWSDHPVLPR